MSWLEKAEKLTTDAQPETRAKVLYTGGELAWLLGEEARGRAWLEESVSIWRCLDDQRRVAYCLQALSFLVDPALGREQARESITIFHATSDAWGEALAVHTLGMIESQRGDPKEARSRLEDGLRRYQQLGDSYLTVQALNLLGDLDRNDDNYPLARIHYEAALAIQETSAFPSNRPSLLQNLGFVSFHLGDGSKAL
ncbi:MAG: tetratricopeptide repeat protein, partial [Tepidiformaceae bacterium]